ncbi:MAG TPA: nickel pincer cofactor biosynthesis protein LarB [Candidatus Hydrogenedentes bacterium]|nr:nickel pincer cofactor biosynthesis protein LarB [Candidatus Hydrogenedentota bacterium]HOL76619.1 nickel pincer cofactor biosynthesis protein LarB [Candidatus Hydrogenedentota bacterium]HPO84452.1 nickel pincer cofactor biosynthesis protein LarB [Candidatus Hydrogenedentota bacterium]
MNVDRLKKLLDDVAAGKCSPEEAMSRLRGMPFEDVEFVKIDHHRALRKGFPEVVFGSGKTPEQVVQIVTRMREEGSNVLVTRSTPEIAEEVLRAHPDVTYHKAARALTLVLSPPQKFPGYVAVLCAGTSDMPVADEAAVTCEIMGVEVERVYDVGVAGIHRLFAQRQVLESAKVTIVCAGMEGALPSVVAGLVDYPVIAVPTSVGYGASFGGVTALLAMLNSCATGVAVVNIDNGFGAGALAALIMRAANR